MRQPSADWVHDLEAIGGSPGVRMTWLAFYWWAGEPWDPIGRWSIWELAPREYLARLPRYAQQFAPMLEALDGPPPRSLRVFDGAGHFVRSNAQVTQEQWDLYRATGALARPFWIIQGRHGGHKIRFTLQEAQLLRLHGLSGEPPRPGDLPYADWDTRAQKALWRQREMHDEALSLVTGPTFTERAHLRMRKDQEERFRRQLLAWLKPQVAEGAAELARPFGKAKVAQHLRPGPEVTDEQLASAEDSFVRETSTDLER